MLGEEVGEPPRRRRHDAELTPGRQFGAVGEDDLRMLSQDVLGDLAPVGSQRMIARGNHEKRDTRQSFEGQRVRNDRKRSDHADAALSLEHGLDGTSERFDVDPKRNARVLLPKLGGNLRDCVDRIEHVDHDR